MPDNIKANINPLLQPGYKGYIFNENDTTLKAFIENNMITVTENSVAKGMITINETQAKALILMLGYLIGR